MGIEPKQDYDKHGKESNSYTRESARETLAKDANLSSADKAKLEGQASCARGEQLRAIESGQKNSEGREQAAGESRQEGLKDASMVKPSLSESRESGAGNAADSEVIKALDDK